jgi:tRNA (mo5U34)-methyltransferase
MTLHAAAHDDPQIADLGPWFHNLHLPGGVRTAPHHPLGDFPSFKWAQFEAHIPADLHGARVLDIGCNAGFYTFALARRGAHVLAIDKDPHYLRQARWARDRLGLDEQTVELRQMDVYDLAGLHERFDVVLFLGVLYHLRYPLLGLDLVAQRTADMLVLQTMTMPGGSPEGGAPEDLTLDERSRLRDVGWPTMAFIEHRLAGDPTNWWAPSAGAVEAMVRSTGMRVEHRPGHELWICRQGDGARPEDLDRVLGQRETPADPTAVD